MQEASADPLLPLGRTHQGSLSPVHALNWPHARKVARKEENTESFVRLLPQNSKYWQTLSTFRINLQLVRCDEALQLAFQDSSDLRYNESVYELYKHITTLDRSTRGAPSTASLGVMRVASLTVPRPASH